MKKNITTTIASLIALGITFYTMTDTIDVNPNYSNPDFEKVKQTKEFEENSKPSEISIKYISSEPSKKPFQDVAPIDKNSDKMNFEKAISEATSEYNIYYEELKSFDKKQLSEFKRLIEMAIALEGNNDPIKLFDPEIVKRIKTFQYFSKNSDKIKIPKFSNNKEYSEEERKYLEDNIFFLEDLKTMFENTPKDNIKNFLNYDMLNLFYISSSEIQKEIAKEKIDIETSNQIFENINNKIVDFPENPEIFYKSSKFYDDIENMISTISLPDEMLNLLRRVEKTKLNYVVGLRSGDNLRKNYIKSANNLFFDSIDKKTDGKFDFIKNGIYFSNYIQEAISKEIEKKDILNIKIINNIENNSDIDNNLLSEKLISSYDHKKLNINNMNGQEFKYKS